MSAKACDMEGKALLRTTQSCYTSLGASGAPGQGQSRGTAGDPAAFGKASDGCGYGPVVAASACQAGLLWPVRL